MIWFFSAIAVLLLVVMMMDFLAKKTKAPVFDEEHFPSGKITSSQMDNLSKRYPDGEAYRAYTDKFGHKYLQQRYVSDYIDKIADDDLLVNLNIIDADSVVTSPADISDSIRRIHLGKKLRALGYLDALARKRSQLVYADDYGDEILDAWNRELESFVSKKFNILKNSASNADSFYLAYEAWAGSRTLYYETPKCRFEDHDKIPAISYVSDYHGMKSDIDTIAIVASLIANRNARIFDSNDPIGYENFVSLQLERLGWKTKGTPSSGDQGADIIAEINGNIAVIQCKLYSGSVGNDAIQQVYAAKEFYGANLAAVVTNSTFTKSAKQLASRLNVLLLHHDQLGEIQGRAVGP
jgi:hypothetical protein